MAKQFDRRYNLQIFNSRGSLLFTTSELRIVFEIQKGLASVSNQGKITIYNASEITREKIREPLNLVILRAGYKDFEDIIFTGDIKTIASGFTGGIRTIISTRKDTEIETVIEAGDGVRALQFSGTALSLAGGTTLTETVKRIAETMPALRVGQLNGLTNKVLTGRGISLSGSSRMLLDALGKSYNFSWSIQDGLLETVASEDVEGAIIGDAGRSAYVLSPNTGMIGAPVLEDSGKIKVKALLNPRIKPGRVVNVTQTLTGKGFYKVLTVKYTGDTDGNEWFVDIEGIPLKSNIQY